MKMKSRVENFRSPLRKLSNRLRQAGLISVVTLAGCSSGVVDDMPATVMPEPVADLQARCSGDLMQAVANQLSGALTVKSISNGPNFVAGTKHFPATETLPEFCQVTGSFVTNPETGKTANFLATFPSHWNGKYLQMGCFGHCGTFAIGDVTQPLSTIAAQGYPFDPLVRGYAVFATDEGHEGMAGGTWAIKPSGEIDEDALQDFYQRATRKLATIGKEFTEAFYSEANSADQSIRYAYLNGCSGGGRDALVAASYFPEEFDGMIAGSPYNGMGTAFQMLAIPLATIRSEAAYVPPELIGQIDSHVMAECDTKDGVKDGLIQNPAACDFQPGTHLPRCEGNRAGDKCFTQEQIETLSVALTAVTDENGKVVQPGFAVSEIQAATFITPPRPADLNAKDPFPGSDNGSMQGGYWPLADALLKVFVHKNDENFFSRSVVSFKQGGKGDVTAYRAVVPSQEVSLVQTEMAPAIGHFPEKLKTLLKADRKLLMWHNLSDQALTPYMSINYYKQLADMYGGYKKLQKNVRLFSLPGTAHCSMGGIGPNTFDALGAMENWVEKGEAPNALIAHQYPTNPWGMKEFDKPVVRSMPLCKFPEMARYNGQGDVKDAANWSCPEGDTGMLEIGESGRQAGALQ